MSKIKSYKRGFSTLSIVATIAGIIVLGSVVYFNTQPEEEIMKEEAMEMMKEGEAKMLEGEQMMKEGEEMMEEAEEMTEEKDTETSSEETGAMEEEGTMMEGETSMEKASKQAYTGKKIAGSDSAPLLEFSEEDYKRAEENGDVIVMFFYANWCPLCKLEFPKMKGAFNDFEGSGVVGFRVNYKDSDTTDAEEDVAREHGVGYQHTKVIVKDGERVLKTPEGWSKKEFLNAINEQIQYE